MIAFKYCANFEIYRKFDSVGDLKPKKNCAHIR